MQATDVPKPRLQTGRRQFEPGRASMIGQAGSTGRAEGTASTAAPGTTVGDVLALLEDWYPPDIAASWDHVGLVAGDASQPVRRIVLTVDATLDVIAQAGRLSADLVVAHHPLLLRGVHSVATSTAKGASVSALVRAGVALYVAHTNADVADPGVSDALAEAVGLTEVSGLSQVEGQWLGRIGTLPAPVPLHELAARLAQVLPIGPGGVRVSGPAQAPVRRVAVLGGAGDTEFAAVRRAGADVFVTADLRHHPALEAREESRGGAPYLIDAGHYATEWLWLPALRGRLTAALQAAGATVSIDISDIGTDPWDFVVGASGPDAHGGTS